MLLLNNGWGSATNVVLDCWRLFSVARAFCGDSALVFHWILAGREQWRQIIHISLKLAHFALFFALSQNSPPSSHYMAPHLHFTIRSAASIDHTTHLSAT